VHLILCLLDNSFSVTLRSRQLSDLCATNRLFSDKLRCGMLSGAFDRLTRSMGAASTRRGLLAAFAAGAVGILLPGARRASAGSCRGIMCADGSCCGSEQNCINGTCCYDTVCNGTCCNFQQTCCNGTCCASDDCTNNACCANPCGGQCCSGSETCISGAWCASNQVCNGSCCTETCLSGTCCCSAGEPIYYCIDGACCPGGLVCGPAGGEFCCPVGTLCKGAGSNMCCTESSHFDTCCPPELICNAQCCSPGQSCIDG
jgi:hypothetical protein